MRLSRLIIGLIINTSLSIQASSIEKYTDQLPSGANLALIVQKIGTKKPYIDFNSQKMSLPASTQKVITALAALLQLGPNFHFTTTFESGGNIKDGVLQGNLVVRFMGDPTFKRQDIHSMVEELKKIGIQKINGDIVIDTSIFSSYDKAPGWAWNDIIQCYGTPSSAAIIDRNCFSISLFSGKKPNDLAFIHISSYYPVIILSQVRTLAKNSPDAQYCELTLTTYGLNHYILGGCVLHRTSPLPLTFAIQDSVSYAGKILSKELNRVGIIYTGALLHQTKKSRPSTIIVSKQSASLRNLLKIMLKNSDNMIADVLFRTIGHVRFGVPGTWRAGSDAVRQILRQQAGIDLGNTITVDGSGLSRYNLMSPATMMHVLQYIAQHDAQLNFISMLPLSNYDGSLQYRAGLHAAGVDKKIYAKTGSLQGVYNLAGFITTARGQKMAFVQYLSGYAVQSTDQQKRRVPLVRFESQLYKDIYWNN